MWANTGHIRQILPQLPGLEGVGVGEHFSQSNLHHIADSNTLCPREAGEKKTTLMHVRGCIMYAKGALCNGAYVESVRRLKCPRPPGHPPTAKCGAVPEKQGTFVLLTCSYVPVKKGGINL